MSPLSVTSAYSGRYFWTARAVKPGHVEKTLLLIAFGSFFFKGLNAAWCGHLMSAVFYVMENAWYAMCLVLLVYVFCYVALHSCKVNIHNRVCGSLPPLHNSLLL